MLDDEVRRFASWVLGLSLPVYAVGTLAARGEDVVALPLTAVVALAPATAAAIVTRRSGRSVRRLLASGLRAPRTTPIRWLAGSLVGMPVLVLATHVVAVPRDVDADGIGPGVLASFVVLALVGAYGEEVGWAAFATRRLLRDHSILSAALLVAGCWAVWHLIPFVHTNRSVGWIAWQTAFTVAFRVLITACFAASGGSALVAVLLHASYNVAWALLPTLWAPYDPAAATIVTTVAASAAVVAARRATRASATGRARSGLGG